VHNSEKSSVSSFGIVLLERSSSRGHLVGKGESPMERTMQAVAAASQPDDRPMERGCAREWVTTASLVPRRCESLRGE
jgi:hypothetical protein